MKKVLILILCLLVTAWAYAGVRSNDGPESDNIKYISSPGGATGTSAFTMAIRVRYGLEPPDGAASVVGQVHSGDVLVWDTTSADGFTISLALADDWHDSTFAGVALEDIATADSSEVKNTGGNVGWMAVQGYCLASCDSGITAGDALEIGDNDTVISGFVSREDGIVSFDIGVCLESPAADNAVPVILY